MVGGDRRGAGRSRSSTSRRATRKGFRAEKVFPDRAHAWRVRFNDRDHDWRAAERIVYAPGFDAGNATKFEQHDFVGVTNANQAIHLATHQLRSQVLQPEEWDFEVDFEHLVANRGDLVLMTHDVLLVGLASGRIKALNLGAGGEILGMISDEKLPMEGLGRLTGSRSARSTTWPSPRASRAVPAARTSTSSRSRPPLDPGSVSVGDLFGFGQFGAETVRGQIKRIKRAGDLAARLTVLPYTDALWNWIMPADFDPGMTPLFDVPAPRIQSVYTGGAALGREADATLVRVVVEVKPLGRADALLEAQARPTATGENYRNAEVVSRPDPEHHRARAACGSARTGTCESGGSWGRCSRVRGRTAARCGSRAIADPALTSLQNLTLSAIGGQALLRWDAPTELDARFGGTVVFRHCPFQIGATWANSTSIGQGVPARNQSRQPAAQGRHLPGAGDQQRGRARRSCLGQHQAGLGAPVRRSCSRSRSTRIGTGRTTAPRSGSATSCSCPGTSVPVGGFGDLGAVAISGYL